MQSDIWSAGILAYEMLQGVSPVAVEEDDNTDEENISATIQAILCYRDSDLVLPEDVSPECGDFLSRALARDPRSRPEASELLQHPW